MVRTTRLRVVVVLAVLGLALHHASAEVSSGSAQQALAAGNARFVTEQARDPHRSAWRRLETAREGQTPFVTIVSCSDSRVPAELIFDCGVGDLFVVRDAGNVCGPLELGSVEYAVEHVHTPLVVVMGHTRCGAVIAAVQGGHAHGSIETILDLIRPAVAQVRKEHPNLADEALVTEVAKANVWQTIQTLITGSPIVPQALREHHVAVVGALYDVASGEVTWLGAHPRQQELVGAAPAP
jgi:carbonic anhydrase